MIPAQVCKWREFTARTAHCPKFPRASMACVSWYYGKPCRCFSITSGGVSLLESCGRFEFEWRGKLLKILRYSFAEFRGNLLTRQPLKHRCQRCGQAHHSMAERKCTPHPFLLDRFHVNQLPG